MTQPIQETTDQRQISGLDYRTRQLARRPSLGGGAVYTDLTIAGRRFHAPQVMVGVPSMYGEVPNDEMWDGLPGRYAIWPGGLVVTALRPFDQLGGAASSGDIHLASSASTQTQNAANKAAAAVNFEFTAEEAGLDVSGYTQYEAIFVFKCSGTANDLHIDWASPASISGTWNHEITSASDHWGNDYYGNRGLSTSEYSPAPGDLHQIKVWFEGSGSTAWCAVIYWLPIADQTLWTILDSDANNWVVDVSDAGGTESATTSIDTTEASTRSSCLVDTQQVDGIFDAAYAVSFAVDTDELPSTWNYWRSADSNNRYTLAPTHEYIEARVSGDAADNGTLHGFITRYDSSFPDSQAYVGTRDWGLVYLGPRSGRWRGLRTQYGLWRPPDSSGFNFPFLDSLGDDVRSGQSFRFLDFLTPQFDAGGARIAFNQLASGAPYIT